jgi:hypothetical protein
MIVAVAKRFDEAMRAMDSQRADGDGRIRLGGTQARAEGVFLASLFGGAFGAVVFAICVAALAALLVWLYA